MRMNHPFQGAEIRWNADGRIKNQAMPVHLT